jgi:predicted RNA binding protein YcfA (HicA-like mRNA interferase family)
MSRRSELVRMARKLGWQVEPTNGGHLRLSKLGCRAVIVSATPSCRRWRRNALAQLRRADRADPHPAREPSP